MAEGLITKGFSIKRQPGFGTIAILCFVLLYLPIATLVVYSFNAGTSIAIWEGFSWRWYLAAWENEQVQEVTVCGASLTSNTVALQWQLPTIAMSRPWVDGPA